MASYTAFSTSIGEIGFVSVYLTSSYGAYSGLTPSASVAFFFFFFSFSLHHLPFLILLPYVYPLYLQI